VLAHLGRHGEAVALLREALRVYHWREKEHKSNLRAVLVRIGMAGRDHEVSLEMARKLCMSSPHDHNVWTFFNQIITRYFMKMYDHIFFLSLAADLAQGGCIHEQPRLYDPSPSQEPEEQCVSLSLSVFMRAMFADAEQYR
jgi:hypothetical protein